MARSPDFKTPECRLSYASSLYKPRAQSEGGEPKYGCTLIFPKTARVELEKQVLAAIVEEWGPDKGPQMAKAGLIKSPFLAGDGKEARNKKTGEIHPGMGADVFFIRVRRVLRRPYVPETARWRTPRRFRRRRHRQVFRDRRGQRRRTRIDPERRRRRGVVR